MSGPSALRRLIQLGANVNAVNDDYETPAHLAAENARLPELVALTLAGADLDAVDRMSQTPAHLAAQRKSIVCLYFLELAGADVNARDYKFRTPRDVYRIACAGVMPASH